MLCRMPRVILPAQLQLQLNESESGIINDTSGPGVAVYFGQSTLDELGV